MWRLARLGAEEPPSLHAHYGGSPQSGRPDHGVCASLWWLSHMLTERDTEALSKPRDHDFHSWMASQPGNRADLLRRTESHLTCGFISSQGLVGQEPQRHPEIPRPSWPIFPANVLTGEGEGGSLLRSSPTEGWDRRPNPGLRTSVSLYEAVNESCFPGSKV